MESTVKFQRKNLASFAQITAPGKYKLVAYSNVTEKNLVEGKYIVTLRAIAADKLAQVKEVFGTSEEVAIDQTNGLFMTANIWAPEGQPTPALPMKGEEIEATIDYVPSRDGEAVLRVTNLKLIAAKAATKLDVSKFFAPVEEGVLTHN